MRTTGWFSLYPEKLARHDQYKRTKATASRHGTKIGLPRMTKRYGRHNFYRAMGMEDQQ